MRTAAALFLALFLPAGIAAAAQGPDCANAVTQSDINICADRDYRKADKALNAAYQAAMKRVQAADRDAAEMGPGYVGAVEALRQAQRGWIQYRDGECEAEGFEARGGSMEPMLVSGCLADLTRKRTRELNELLKPE